MKGDAGIPRPLSVSFHLWEPCNMRCRFCFATFQDVKREALPRGHLPREQALAVTEALANTFDKVTFAGGEPTLCPWLADLCSRAKERGATTMLVTNGSRVLQPGWLDAHTPHLDWVVLSVDSARQETLRWTGRTVAGKYPLDPAYYMEVAQALRARGVRLKVNTVVTSANARENISHLIQAMRPERWKVLQMLPVSGQNDGAEDLHVSTEEFWSFCERHRGVAADMGVELVPEDNKAMTASYALVDPAGRFFDNSAGCHRYGRPILEVGVEQAWQDVAFNQSRYVARGGVYDWGGKPSDLVQLRTNK